VAGNPDNALTTHPLSASGQEILLHAGRVVPLPRGGPDELCCPPALLNLGVRGGTITARHGDGLFVSASEAGRSRWTLGSHVAVNFGQGPPRSRRYAHPRPDRVATISVLLGQLAIVLALTCLAGPLAAAMPARHAARLRIPRAISEQAA
jgi:hypothetical protein